MVVFNLEMYQSVFLFSFMYKTQVLLHLSSVKETNGTRSLLRLFFIMGNHDDGASVFFIQSVKQFHDFGSHP